MKRWFAHSPGMIYAISVYADNARDARAELRAFLGVKRLRKGSAVWLDRKGY